LITKRRSQYFTLAGNILLSSNVILIDKGISSMNKIIILMLGIMLSGCITTDISPQTNPIVKNNQNIQVYPKWKALLEGSDLKTDINYKYYPKEMNLSNDMLLRGWVWNDFLKKYVESFPLEKRDDILKGLTRFTVDYDKVEKIIKFEPLRYISGPYSSNSYVSLQGNLTKSKAYTLLKINYYGNSWVFAHKITVVADDFTWKSPELKFYRNHSSKVWEYTFLDLSNPQYRNIANKIASSKEVIIRFHGKQYYDDLQVTPRMKKDILEMLKAIDAINGKS